jgi:hypothetical protein
MFFQYVAFFLSLCLAWFVLSLYSCHFSGVIVLLYAPLLLCRIGARSSRHFFAHAW